MILVRATCICGFHTRKARSGFHFDRWYFPLLNLRTFELSDLEVPFPESERKRIKELNSIDFKATVDRGREARNQAAARMAKREKDAQRQYILSKKPQLKTQYENDPEVAFDPAQEGFTCPECGKKDGVRIQQVKAIAVCRLDCGHEYIWPDSQHSGCPLCGHRPHRFKTETEPEFADLPRIESACGCASTLVSGSHVDAYCPKCGRLPGAYRLDDVNMCGKHHIPMKQYKLRSNFLFISTFGGPPRHLFPNAKLFGDASDFDDAFLDSYCPQCEDESHQWELQHLDDADELADKQRYIALNHLVSLEASEPQSFQHLDDQLVQDAVIAIAWYMLRYWETQFDSDERLPALVAAISRWQETRDPQSLQSLKDTLQRVAVEQKGTLSPVDEPDPIGSNSPGDFAGDAIIAAANMLVTDDATVICEQSNRCIQNAREAIARMMGERDPEDETTDFWTLSGPYLRMAIKRRVDELRTSKT